MALPTVSALAQLRAWADGQAIGLSGKWTATDTVTAINHQVISVTSAYENLPFGEVDPAYAVIGIKHLGSLGAILLTYDTIKPAGFGYVKPGECHIFRLPDIGGLVVEMIAAENAGPHLVEVLIISGDVGLAS